MQRTAAESLLPTVTDFETLDLKSPEIREFVGKEMKYSKYSLVASLIEKDSFLQLPCPK